MITGQVPVSGNYVADETYGDHCGRMTPHEPHTWSTETDYWQCMGTT